MYFEEISTALQKGNATLVKELVQKSIDANVSVKQILDKGLLSAMGIIGAKFKNNEVYIPEVLIAARAMNAGLAILEPLLVAENVEAVGKIVIGTVKGDMHDIGKNLVAMMMKGAGFEVHDIGVDAGPEKFISKAEEVGADIICMSALLTTTMSNMKTIIAEMESLGIRDKYFVMVGGAPVTSAFAEQIGANVYTPDAATAAQTAKSIMLD